MGNRAEVALMMGMIEIRTTQNRIHHSHSKTGSRLPKSSTALSDFLTRRLQTHPPNEDHGCEDLRQQIFQWEKMLKSLSELAYQLIG
jgi:hypothetical protein